MRPLLSACMIMRDEAAVLDDCLTSLDGVVDEVVIVDTGSVDESVDIARRHGARILHRPWDDDFATPRNLGLDHATGDWILYIDADERLSGADRSVFERLLAGAPEVAFRVLLRPHSAMTPYLEYRLWRNDPRIRFRGAIHERVVPAIRDIALAEGRPVSTCLDILLEHVGYEGDQHRKHLRNLPMLERIVEEQPDHLFARYHLALVLDGLERSAEAEAVLEHVVADLREAGPPAERDGVLAFAALIGMRRRQAKEFRGLLDEALALYPDNAVLHFIDGEDRVSRSDYEAALACFDAVLRIAATDPTSNKPAYSRALIGPYTHAARGSCLFKLGRYRAAADAYAAALREEPGDQSYALKHRLALSRVEKGAGGTREGAETAGRAGPERPRRAEECRDDVPAHRGSPRETDEEAT